MKVIVFIRSLIRPIVTLTGWGVICWMVSKFASQISDMTLIVSIVMFFLGAMSMALGFWFGQKGVTPWQGK